jgi:hypothetical protein
MSEPKAVYVTDAASQFIEAFVARKGDPRVLAALLEHETWRRGAAQAGSEEKSCLAQAEYWRKARMECEAKAREIEERYPELKEGGHA